MNKSIRKVIVLVSALAANDATLAADVDYEIRIGGIYSDNVRRTATMDQDEKIAFAGFALDVGHESRRIEFRLNSDLSFQHYIDESFDDEIVGALGADLDFSLVQNFLTWGVSNRFGKLQTNPFMADTEANRGDFNSFSTGPNFQIHLGNRSSFDIGARYTDNYFEKRNNDNEVVSVELGLSRAISANRSIAISVSYDDVMYDDVVLNSDYERTAAFLSFQSQVSKGQVSVALGANEIEINNQTIDGTFANFAFSRELTSRTSLNLAYDQQFSNSGDVFRRSQDLGQNFNETQDVPGDGEPFESRRFSGTLDYNYSGSDFFLRVASDEEDYESNNSLERRRNEIQFGVARRLGSKWRVTADGRFSSLDYQNIDRDDDDVRAGIGISRQLTRTLYLDLNYSYADRSSSSAGADYSDNRYALTLRFDPE